MEHVGIEVETIVAENMEQERPPAAMLLLFAQLHGVFQHLSSLRPAQLREQAVLPSHWSDFSLSFC